jgi:hypothetical protein
MKVNRHDKAAALTDEQLKALWLRLLLQSTVACGPSSSGPQQGSARHWRSPGAM